MTIKHKDMTEALDTYQAGLAAEGDRTAFALLYKRWHPKLMRFAIRQIGDAEAAKDIMQEAAVTMAVNIHRLENPALFAPWAYTILRRRTADYISKLVRERSGKRSLEQTALPPPIRDIEETLSLKQALANLPKSERLLLTLFYVDGLKGRELAAAMGLPLGTIKSRLFTARQKLKSHYTPTSKGDEND